MYLNPQIHDTQDTLTIRVGYIGIHLRIRISSPAASALGVAQDDALPARVDAALDSVPAGGEAAYDALAAAVWEAFAA